MRATDRPDARPLSLRAYALAGLGGFLALLAHAGTLAADPATSRWLGLDAPSRTVARADTDTVAVGRPGEQVSGEAAPGARGDSAAADTTEADSLARARYLLPALPRDNVYAVPVERLVPSLLGGRLRQRQQSVVLDSAALVYTASERFGDTEIRTPVEFSLDQYLAAQRAAALEDGFRSLTASRLQRQQRRAGVGFEIDIPGGNQSAFSTIFGKNEVDLRVTGNSVLDLGGGYNQNALTQASSGRDGTFAPDFGQELNLNVAGTIGDKLRINVNYDTQSDFDFENQVSLVYTGYEDDIVQKIEAGNVFLQTPSELIRGGQRLFGLRTDLQFGPLSVTAVASQQDAEENEIEITGGSQSTAIALPPTRYEDATHFFLGFAFYNWWDEAHADPTLPTNPPGLARISGLEVWVQDAQARSQTTTTDEIVYGTALVDLGEPLAVLEGGRSYLDALGPAAPLPSPGLDQYSPEALERLRTQSESVQYTTEFGLAQGDYQGGLWRKLTAGTDYTFDENLGWLSLGRGLGPTDALAVTYQYRPTQGPVVTVGDFANASTTADRRTILKLLRDVSPVPEDAPWDLTMRNIYRIGGRSLNEDDFTLSVTYERPGGTAQETLPNVQISDGFRLLQALGLDRTSEGGLPRPDNRFDFLPGYTVDAQNGRIIFPVREPFGRYLEGLLRDGRYIGGEEVNVGLPGAYEDVASDVVFNELYSLKPEVAARELNKLDRYRIEGEYRGASQSVFDIGFGIVEGSVVVTSGGQQLVEGADYVVNETAGTVEIRNPVYLAPGQQVRVTAERNQLFAIGAKTLVGLRSDYRLSENAGFGATWMRLSERPVNDKFRIGDEALQNTIFGFDGGFTYEPRWVTRLLDGLPLIQTRAPSSFEVRGEYARFSPGHPEAFAFREVQRDLDAISDLSGVDRSLTEDERRGISSIDDFEGAETANTALQQAGGWRLAAAPTGAGPLAGAGTVPYVPGATPITDPRLATNWRGLLGWYSISSEQTFRTLENAVGALPLAARRVLPTDLYEGRNIPANENQPLNVLDFYFDPARRGPYNYNLELGTTYAADPAAAWGGMVRSIDAAYADFDGANTIESVEFIVAPLGGRNGDEAIDAGAVLHIDLGLLNEDVLPNGALNSEDGISATDPAPDEVDEWGRTFDGLPNNAVEFYAESGRTEDLGLDGLASRRDLVAPGGVPYALAEADLPGVQAFLDALPDGIERTRALADPAGDDYRNFREDYFGDATFFPNGASVQERYAHYFAGTELNTNVPRDQILGDEARNGITQLPSTEDVNVDVEVTRQEEEEFFRYTLPLDENGLVNSPYFTGSTIEAAGTTWYLVRIPVRDPSADFGGNLANVQMARMWTTGHRKPATIRFATLELVGSQWQKSDVVGIVEAGSASGASPDLFIASVNTDENPRSYLAPVSALKPVQRDFSGASREAREQSLVMRVEGLGEGQARGLFKPYTTQRLDLTKYTNLRMFTHGEGFEARDDLRVFIRLGSDETENYYELEQPLYPAPSDDLAATFDFGSQVGRAQAADYLWQTNACPGGDDPDARGPDSRATCADEERRDLNSLNVVIAELNGIKVARDAAGAPLGERFSEDRTPEGAPPGARLSIIGTPSVQSVSTVVVGVRNAESGDPTPLAEVEVWFNELRVTGYDEGGGASAFVTAQARLADVANATARVSLSQDGFGALGNGLGERDFVDRLGVTFSSTFNAHKFLPERYGWSAPVQFSYTQNESTPRFDPTNSDIRLDDLAERTLSDESLPEAQRTLRADSIRQAAQTFTSQRTVSTNLRKTGSRSPWLKYTLDGLALSYTNTSSDGRNPRQALTSSDAWRANANYTLQVPRPRTVRPFWFTGGVPLLGSAVENLRLNLLPRSLTFRSSLGRTVGLSRERPREADLGQPVAVNEFLYPRRVTHDFSHGRSFSLQYEPFSFLPLTYGSNSTQSLDLAGVNERFELLVRDTSGVFGEVGRIERFDLSREDALIPGSPLWERFGVSDASQLQELEILGGTTPQLSVVPWAETIGGTLGGYRDLLTDRYDQQATATLRVSTRNVKWLAWVQPKPIGVSSSYVWDFQPVTGFEDQTVAGVGSTVQLTSGLTLKPRDFWRLFPFYRGLEEDDRRARQEREQRRRERDAERQRRRAEREQERQRRELEALGEATTAEETLEEIETPSEVEIPGVEDAPEAPVARRTPGALEDTEASGADDDAREGDAEPRRPLVDVPGLGRKVFLAVTGLEDVSVTYRGSLTSQANGVLGDGFSLLAGITGNAPPLAYRLGADRRLPLSTRLSDPEATLRLQDVLAESHQIEGRTTLQPTQDLRISVTATTNWDNNDTFPLERTPEALVEQDPIRRGSGQSTVFAFGSSYEDFLQRHLDRFTDDVAGGANPDGNVLSAVGSASGLSEDFAGTFARGLGRFGPDGLFTLPLPSWEVSWTGLGKLPLFSRLTQQVTLQHNYFATNQASYASLDAFGDRTRVIANTSLLEPLAEVEPTTLVVNERFQPLVGVRVGWKGGLQTEMTLNRGRVLTLQPGSARITQRNTDDLQVNVTYSKAGFRLPFFSRLRNTLRFRLNASVSDDRTRQRAVVDDLEKLIAADPNDPLEDPPGTRLQRVSIWPSIGYQISNRVNMDVFFRYEETLNQGSTGSPRIATYDGGVTLRISFAN